MIKIPVTIEMLQAFYTIVKAKSTYLCILIRAQKMCIYAELNEIYYLSLCEAPGVPDLSLRLPVEAMRVIMNRGYLELETIEHADNTVSEKITSYDEYGKLLCSVKMASEYSDNEEQILSFLDTVFHEEYRVIEDPKIFETALSLTRVNIKELGIKGVQMSHGKIFTIANSFAAYREDPLGLSLVLSTSSLKELVSFCTGRSNVRLQKHGGYNLCSWGTHTIAWRRVRAEQFMDLPDVTYDVSVNISTANIAKVFRYVATEVSDCVLNFRENKLEVYSQVGNYEVPLGINPVDTESIHVNYKLLSKLLNTADTIILLEANESTLHIGMNDTHYLMGVRR